MDNVRWYSEKEYPLGPPRDQTWAQGPNGEPIQLPRDTRMWASIEWAERMGIEHPDRPS